MLFLSVSFHQLSILFIYRFILAKGKMDEVWETSEQKCFFRKSQRIEHKIFDIQRTVHHDIFL